MSIAASVATALDREFLGIRCRLIELATALDRIDRAADTASDDARLAHIRRSLGLLMADGPDRAERVQREFSLPFDERN